MLQENKTLKKTPEITVLMAVYNGGKFLRETIDSTLKQTYKDFEFLIVNDASTDATLKIIKSYKDKRVIVHNNNANIGQTKSLNIGLKLARGKYIARIDAGDFSYPARLEKQLKHIREHPEYILVGTAGVIVDSNGKLVNIACSPNTFPKILTKLFYDSPLIHISVLMEKDIIVKLGGYDENFSICADYELWSKLVRHNYCFTSISDVLVGYRVESNSLTYKNFYGKSFSETSEIIKRNVNSLTNLNISYEEAQRIRKMFTFGLQNFSKNEIEDTETTFKKIFLNLRSDLGVNISAQDVNRHFMSNYLSLVIYYIENGRLKEARQTIIDSFRKYGFCTPCFLIFLTTFLGKKATKKVRDVWHKFKLLILKLKLFCNQNR